MEVVQKAPDEVTMEPKGMDIKHDSTMFLENWLGCFQYLGETYIRTL